MRAVRTALFLLLLPGAVLSCLASGYTNTAAVARAAAAAALGTDGVSSVTTAVVVDGTIVYAEAFGRIGSNGTAVPDARTQFNAGSISKVFTAVALLRLRDRGKVELDRPVVDYLPQFTMIDARYRGITVRMLLDHTAGIPGTNYYELFGAKRNPGYVSHTMALLGNTELKSNPGDANVYCNDCFTVAQALVETLSGKSFSQFVQDEIFARAGMPDSTYGFREGNGNIAATYSADGSAMLPSEYVSAHASGGLTTTAVDLCAFARALLDGGLLTPASWADLQQAQPGRAGAGFSLAHAGLGWDSVAEPDFAARGLTVLGKDGITAFFRSQMYVAPKENIAVATILAGPAATPVDVVTGISKRILWAALEDSGQLPASRRIPGPPLPPAAPIPSDLLAYAGVYGGFGHSMIRITFDQAANTLVPARLVDGQFVPGVPFGYRIDGSFYTSSGRGYSFARSPEGRPLLRQHVARGGGVATVLERVSSDGHGDSSAFAGMTWVPQNLRASDFVTLSYGGLYRTDAIDALPGIVYLHAGNPGDATPYALADAHRSRMILEYEADLVGMQIVTVDGRKMLRSGAFEFADAASVPAMPAVGDVVVDASGRNVARRVVAAGTFATSLPANGRFLVYAPEGTIAFDSLFDGNAAVKVLPGSLLLFIGDPGAAFAARIT